MPLPRFSTVPFGKIVVLSSLLLLFEPFLGFEFASPLFGAMTDDFVLCIVSVLYPASKMIETGLLPRIV